MKPMFFDRNDFEMHTFILTIPYIKGEGMTEKGKC